MRPPNSMSAVMASDRRSMAPRKCAKTCSPHSMGEAHAEDILERLPTVQFAAAYGSAAFSQAGDNRGEAGLADGGLGQASEMVAWAQARRHA